MAEITLKINGKEKLLSVDPETPLLWVLRDELGMKGTKYGCGIGQCGACTVHLDGVSVRSCQLPVLALTNRSITTIEGISEKNEHPVQKAWISHQVPQCGYCQSGQIMSAVAMLKTNKSPNDREIEIAISGNICRCGTYPRIKKAIKQAANEQ
ncbi:MAG: (2Fe-2S)-binding protein [Cyclobacteriaceae bacterium]